jgi:homoserine kinase
MSESNGEMKNEVRVFAPATVANVAAGFDVLGFALHQPGDEVVVFVLRLSPVTTENSR